MGGGGGKPAPGKNKEVAAQQRAAAEAKAAQEAAAKAEAEAKAQAAAEIAAEKEAARQKAIRGGESAEDIAARTAQTTKNPKRARIRGRRSLLSGNLGIGDIGSKESLG